MMNFKDISYLLQGSHEQQRVYHLLVETNILGQLATFDPILIGTFPLDIQTAISDIDIICYCQDLQQFKADLNMLFGQSANFSLTLLNNMGVPAVVANFNINGQKFEIFGQNIPTSQQLGYLHLVAEHNILAYFGNDFKTKVIALKQSGVKTEPAFCWLLDIDGDPYQELLTYSLLQIGGGGNPSINKINLRNQLIALTFAIKRLQMRRDIFQAIADPTRRAILGLLALQAMTPNAIADHFNTSRQAVSKHIQILTECEVVMQKQKGREIYYHFNAGKMKEVDVWLERFRSLWSDRFDQLDDLLENL